LEENQGVTSAALAELFITRGLPAHIRSENGPEFIAMAVQQWLAKIGVKTLYITRRLLGRTATTKPSTRRFVWRRHYNTIRPHSSVGYRPLAPEAASPPLPPSSSASRHLQAAMATEARMH
jgi:transposase InsO family protein